MTINDDIDFINVVTVLEIDDWKCFVLIVENSSMVTYMMKKFNVMFFEFCNVK